MAKNSLESRLVEQGDMIIQLNKTILSLQQASAQALESFNAKEAALLQEIQKLREQISSPAPLFAKAVHKIDKR